MECRYDLHVHSALSPCAEKDMTPVDIVGTAKLLGLNFVAIADHNSIKNVEVALRAGEAYGINVVPAFELQTSEDIHILCLFETFEKLREFYGSIRFSDRKNRPDIFGRQLIINEDDEITGEEERMLLDSADISSEYVPELAAKFGGAAIPAHIDRDMNGMLNILGTVTDNYRTVEFSAAASEALIEEWRTKKRIIIDSDAHTLDAISKKGEIELPEPTVAALMAKLRGEICGSLR